MNDHAALADYQERLAGLPEESFIGSILWFSVAGAVERGPDGARKVVPVRVSHLELEQWFDELGLDPAFLPPSIKRIDAFRNASSSVRRTYDMPVDGQSAELLVVEVRSDVDQVTRHVMRQVRDERQVKLDYDHLATLKFIRGGRTSMGKRSSGDHWKHQILSRTRGQDRAEVEALIEEIDERYHDLAANLHSAAIRAVLRSYLGHLNAIPMKSSGGLYFVHQTRQADLDGLQQLARRIGQGTLLEQFPLVDTEDSREMLKEAYQSEVEEECRLLLRDIAELNDRADTRGGAVDPKAYAALNGRYQEVMANAAEYTEMLGRSQGRAAAALELALDAVADLATRLAPARRSVPA